MPRELPVRLRDLASFQEGILTSRQALDEGVTRDVIQSRFRQGRWQRVYPGVYAVFSGELARPAVLWAAALHAGPGAALSHHTAAELAGLTDRPAALIHVTIPGDRRLVRTAGVLLHRSDRLDQVRHPSQAPPRTRIEETVLDLAGCAATAEDAYDWITRALGRRLTTQARLRDAMAQRSRLRWRQDLAEAVTSDWDGVHSRLERRYVRDVERPHALPRGIRQARVRRGTRNEYRDVLYDEYAVAVELDGRAAHPGDTRWSDIRRDNAAAADGIVSLRYGWRDVSQYPCLVAAQIAEVLRRRGYGGDQGCSPCCPVSAVRP
jgi:very-short-patch-repair endonuclease